MFRQNSFSTKGLGKRSESYYDQSNHSNEPSVVRTIASKSKSFAENKDIHQDDSCALKSQYDGGSSNCIFLKSSGKFINKEVETVGGLVATFWNYPVRNKQWPVIYTCFNQKTGGFAIADERGQVYKMSILNNLYQSVRLASCPVSCMTFLYSQKNLLAIAYENGVIVIINTDTKDIVGNIQVRNKSTARIIKCHPKQPRLVIATDDRTISMWDYSLCHCLQSMDCEEPIVDVRFELSGDVIAVTLERSGAYLYAADTCRLLAHLALPDSERRPAWTAYCSCLLDSLPAETLPGMLAAVRKPSTAAPSKLLNVLLSGDNCMVYSWCVDVREAVVSRDQVSVNMSTSTSGMRLTRTPVKSHLVGVVEMPIKMRTTVSMVPLSDSQHPPRVALLSADGSALLLEIDGFREKNVGYWRVIADLPASLLHGDAAQSVSLTPCAVGKYSNKRHANTSSHHQLHNNSSLSSSSFFASPDTACGKFDASHEYLAVAGQDGGMRLFDAQAAAGYGELCGAVLRSRSPYFSSGAGALQQQQQTYQHQQAGTQSQNAAANSTNINPVRQQSEQDFRHNKDGFNAGGGSTHNGPSRYDSDDFYLQDSSLDSPGEAETKAVRSVGGRTAITTIRTTTSRAKTTASSARTTVAQTSGNTALRSAKSRTAEAPSVVASSGAKLHSFVSHKGSKRTGSLSDQELLSTPLFELATLTTKEKQVNMQKLRTFLSLNGEFPTRYRPLIWRFLLKLPENSRAFSDLVQRGVHPGYENLFDLYPVESRKIFVRLQNLCSQLAHWAPILADAPYLPSLVFPFVLLYGSDELAALETSMTIMMWWGFSWHATHPGPPVHLADALDSLLKLHESKLYYHLVELKVAPGLLCWSMLSTLFTELLSRNNWFVLMDFLFAHFDNVGYVLLVPVALLKEVKSALLGCDVDTQVHGYLRAQQEVDMPRLIRSLGELMGTTAPKYLTAIATKHIDRTRFQQGTSEHVVQATDLDEVQEARENLALGSGNPMFPLPADRYPAYDGYPKHILDQQIKERNRVLALGQEVARKEGVLQMLEKKLQEIESDHAVWMNRHLTASDAELRHQKEMMAKEKAHLRELQRIEEEISLNRIKGLSALEEAAKEEMRIMDQAAADSRRLLEESEEHMREKMEISLSLQKHRELAEQAEIATQEKIRQLRMRRTRDDWVKSMAGTLKSKEDELAARDAIINERWKKQDDEARLQRELRVSQSKAFEENDAIGRLQEDMTTRMQRLQLEREAKIIEIERARAIRLAKEQAEEALEAQERASLLLRKQEVLNSTEQSNLMSMRTAQMAEEKMMETVTLIREESARLIDAERVHALRNSKARQDARQAQLRREWAEKSSQQLQAVLSAEGELQEQMLKLQRASLRSEAEATYAHGAAMDEHTARDARRDIESLGDRVLSQQRERFQEMKEYLRTEQQAARRRDAPSDVRGGDRVRQSSDSHGSEFRRLQDNYYIDTHTGGGGTANPSWTREQASIPAPPNGTGIGYGVQPAETQPIASSGDSANQREQQQHDRITGHTRSQRSSDRRYDTVVVEDVNDDDNDDGDDSSSSSSSTVNNQLPLSIVGRSAEGQRMRSQQEQQQSQPALAQYREHHDSDSDVSDMFAESLPLSDAMKIASNKLLGIEGSDDDDDETERFEDATDWDSAAMRYATAITSNTTTGTTNTRSTTKTRMDDIYVPTSFTQAAALAPSLSLPNTIGAEATNRPPKYGSTGNTVKDNGSSLLDKATTALSKSSSGTQTKKSGLTALRTSGNRNSGDLKKLADQSLRNLQETRTLNRYEEVEEDQAQQVRTLAAQLQRQQQHQQQQSGRSKPASITTKSRSSTSTATSTSRVSSGTSTGRQQRGERSSAQQPLSQTMRRPASAGGGRVAREQRGQRDSDRLDVTVDSDSALWAFESSP